MYHMSYRPFSRTQKLSGLLYQLSALAIYILPILVSKQLRGRTHDPLTVIWPLRILKDGYVTFRQFIGHDTVIELTNLDLRHLLARQLLTAEFSYTSIITCFILQCLTYRTDELALIIHATKCRYREIPELSVSFHYDQCFNCITVRTNGASKGFDVSFRIRKFDNFVRCNTVSYDTYTFLLQKFRRYFSDYTSTRSCNLRQIFYFRNFHVYK